MLKKILLIILFPLWYPFGTFFLCRHRLRLKKILKMRRENIFRKEQIRILEARFERVDPAIKEEILRLEKLEQDSLSGKT